MFGVLQKKLHAWLRRWLPHAALRHAPPDWTLSLAGHACMKERVGCCLPC